MKSYSTNDLRIHEARDTVDARGHIDNSDEEFLEWAKQVNPSSVMKRLRQELKQSRKDSERVRYH